MRTRSALRRSPSWFQNPTCLTLAAALLALAVPAIAQVDTPANCQGINAARPFDVAIGGPSGAFNSDVNWATTAEDVFVAQSGSITGLVFWGRYNSRNATTPAQPPYTPTFRVRLYRNAWNNAPDTRNTGPTAFRQYVIGASSPANGLTLTPGTSLTVASAASVWPDNQPAGRSQGFKFTATVPGDFPVRAGERIWISVEGGGSRLDGSDRFRWGVTNDPALAPHQDDRVFFGDPATLSAQEATSGNMALCVSVGIAPNPRPVAANARCATALSLATPQPGLPTIITSSARGLPSNAPFCGTSTVSGPVQWYTVVGNGRRIEASLCNAATTYDTVLAVYCGNCDTQSDAGLNCVASNDAAPGLCTQAAGADASTVEFDAAAGLTYRVAVWGYAGAEGAHTMTLSDKGAPALPPSPCQPDRCPVSLADIAPVNLGPACGSSDAAASAAACDSSGVKSITVGQWAGGYIESGGRDFWNLTPDPGAYAWVKVQIASGFPGEFGLFTGACGGTAAAPNGTRMILSPTDDVDVRYCQPLSRFGRTDGSGKLRLVILEPTGKGLPCGTAPGNNAYRFKLDIMPVGACCTSIAECSILPGEICNQTLGASFSVGGTCAPTGQCVPAPNAICCRGATCNFVPVAGCNIADGAQAGKPLATPAGSACNASGSLTSPCCFADYDKLGGVATSDIFAYLADWFTGQPYAIIGGSGDSGSPQVPDIFGYLSVWFAGC